MKSAKELLDFDRFDENALARRAPQPIVVPQKNLKILEEIVNNHANKGIELPNREDLRQIYHNFINAHQIGRLHAEFDSFKRTRQLAWALTYSEGGVFRIVDTPQLSDALGLIEGRFRISALFGVFNTLLQAWDTSNAGILRTFVKKHLTDYNGSRKLVQKLKTNISWYCEENGTTQLALNLLRSRVKLSDVWSTLELPDHMHSYPYFGAVAEAYIALNRRVDQETVVDVTNFVEKHKNDKTSRVVLSKLIENLGYDASEHLRQSIQSYVLREWGDPRIAGGEVRWRDVPDKAKQIFTRWITKEDLRFFFDAVAKACDDNKFTYRKAFWLAYLEHISFCRPILRKDAEYLFSNNPQTLQYYRERQPATLTGGNNNQHAFIIQMGNHTFVEFSTAAACYVYHNVDLPFQLGDSEYNIIELRDQLWAEHRVTHHNSENYSWQVNFTSWINSELGIKPMRSYRLGNPDNNETEVGIKTVQSYQLEDSDTNETDDITKLIQGLSNKQTRLESSQALVKIGKPAVPALIDLLHNRDHATRLRAVNTLGELGSVAEAAIPTLQQLRAFDPKDYIRDRVNRVLKQINPSYQNETDDFTDETEVGTKTVQSYQLEDSDTNETDDITELIQGLCNKQTRLESSRALVRIGEPAVPALIGALHDEDHRVRVRAINALGQLGRVAEAAIPMLQQLRQLDPKDYIRDRADWVLQQVNPSYQVEPSRSSSYR